MPKINVPGLLSVKGNINRQYFVVDQSDYHNFMACQFDEIRSKFSQQKANLIISKLKQTKEDKKVGLGKNWLSFADENGCLEYFGLLCKNYQDKKQYLIATYHFKVQFQTSRDLYITRYTSYTQKTNWAGGGSSTYVCIDTVEAKKRGYTEEDLQILQYYTKLQEEEFDKLKYSQAMKLGA